MQNNAALIFTAIPYSASTGPEQGFPCVSFPHREKPVFTTGFPGDENMFFPGRKSTQGKPCFHYRDGFAVNGEKFNWMKNTLILTRNKKNAKGIYFGSVYVACLLSLAMSEKI